ncbi:hypothetical protein, partial [Pseudomonas syringae group genomosp. 7]|uniref:hypothetical protein n=1 Tax=Pseudomonas syringae group genomosp. 7 TaxID=251699 RepID=UPI003770277F
GGGWGWGLCGVLVGVCCVCCVGFVGGCCGVGWCCWVVVFGGWVAGGVCWWVGCGMCGSFVRCLRSRYWGCSSATMIVVGFGHSCGFLVARMIA